MDTLSNDDYARYERSLMVDGFGEDEQQKLKTAKVLVVGAGGLGSAVLPYLVAAGVGTVGIAEFDVVSISNLQRQVLYTDSDLGGPKAELAAERLVQQNPTAEIITYAVKLTEENAEAIFKDFDLVVDCTDNYAVRYIIDRYTKKLGKPMVYGSAQESKGQLGIFNVEGGKSYADLYPESESGDDRRPVGVLSPMPGIIGCMQAMEVVKLITGYGEPLIGRLLTVDAASMQFQLFKL